jgi:hypothetical protein
LDPEPLRQNYLSRSAATHPDHFHSAAAETRDEASAATAALNTAYNKLRETRDRLAHLLELELGRRPAEIQAVPPGVSDLFFQVAKACQEADRCIADRAAITSPLLKVQMFERSLSVAERVSEVQSKVGQGLAALEVVLKSLNESWENAPAIGSPGRAESLPLGQLEEVYRAVSYLARWRAQLQERFVQLSM